MIKRIFITIVSLFILAAAGGWYYVKFRMNDDLREALTEKIHEASNGTYVFKAKSVELNIFTSEIRVEELELIPYFPDSLPLFDHVELRVFRAEVKFKNLYRILFSKKPVVKTVYFTDPEITFFKTGETFESPPQVFGAEHVEFVNGKFTRVEVSENKRDTVFVSSGINLKFDAPKLDSHSVFTYDRAHFSSSGFSFPIRGRPEYLQTGSVGWDSQKRTVDILDIELNIDVPANRYAPVSGIQRSAPKCAIERLTVVDLDIQLPIDSGGFSARRIDAEGISAEFKKYTAYNDLPKLEKPLPAEFLEKLSFGFHCDSIRVSDMRVEIYQIDEQQNTGFMVVNDISFLLQNASNGRISGRSDPGEAMLLRGSCTMGTGSKVNVSGSFERDHPLYAFRLRGSSPEVKTSDFNAFVKPLTSFYFKTGSLNDLSFEFYGDAKASRGSFESVFESVKIAAEEVHGNGSAGKKAVRKLSVTGINALLGIKELIAGSESRKGEINYTRNPEKSVFNYWLMSALSGIADAAGTDVEKLESRE